MSALYVKNVPAWERTLRIVLAVTVVAYALGALGGVVGIALAGGAAMFAVTGLLGYCPACAMVGRRLDRAA